MLPSQLAWGKRGVIFPLLICKSGRTGDNFRKAHHFERQLPLHPERSLEDRRNWNLTGAPALFRAE